MSCQEEATRGDVCEFCGKDLKTVEEIHAAEGTHFCSEQCAVDHYTNEIIANAKESAKAIYKDFAEVISPVDIGLVEERVYTAYSKEVDITFILKDIIDIAKDTPVSTEVLGFYFGEPDDESTQLFNGKLKATY